MNREDYYKRPDGETFVDVPTKPIPHADTWPTLSTNQLIEVQITLQQRAWEFRQNAAITTSLQMSLLKLQALISQKLLDNS